MTVSNSVRHDAFVDNTRLGGTVMQTQGYTLRELAHRVSGSLVMSPERQPYSAANLRDQLSRIAQRELGAALTERAQPADEATYAVNIVGVASLSAAQPHQLAYCHDTRFRKQLQATRASAVLIRAEQLSDCPVPAIVVDRPELAFARIAQLFSSVPTLKSGIHSTAVIGERCQIDPTACIGPNCVLGDDVTIGPRTQLFPGVILSNQVRIGQDTVLYSRVTVYHQVDIADRVIIHSGAVIGADGFGFTQNELQQWEKIPQLAGVRIGNDVEIGANTTIDRGSLNTTTIQDGVKIDNQVQIGHNTDIGQHCIIAGCTGIAGSVTLGAGCMIGGASAINSHAELASGVILAAMTGVNNSIKEPGIYGAGLPPQPHQQWAKNMIRIKQLDQLFRRVKQLENARDE